MIRYRTLYLGKEARLRDLEARDVDALVAYWHGSPPDFLQSLGVDLSKLRSAEETRQRFLAGNRVTFVVESEGELVGYASVNVRSDQGYGHVHLLQQGLRSKALAYVIFPHAIRMFFHTVPLQRIVFETSPENRNINRLLRRFGLTPRQQRLDAPDGMARPGWFNIYAIMRNDAEHLHLVG